MEIKNILITGFDGYIGAVLSQALLKKKFVITGLDTFYFQGKFFGSYVQNFSTLKKDIRNIKKNDLEKFDAIIHLAGLSNDALGEIDQTITKEINYQATVRLAKLAKRAGVKRFIFSSSCSIYGKTKNDTVFENSRVNPLTAYAMSKILSEKALIKLADENFCVGILRNSTVYGFSPKFRDDLVVNNFVSCGIATKQIKVLSDGSPWRPLIDVRDLSKIFIEFLLADRRKINGQIFNVGFNENNFQIKDILKIIHEEMPDCKIIFAGEHGADTRSYRVNFDKFVRAFPYIKQEWPLKKAVRDMILRLMEAKYTKRDYNRGVFTRLAVIKDLIKTKEVDDSLFWKDTDVLKCRLCNNIIIPFFSLGQMPLVNHFLTKNQIHSEKKYDLTVSFCPNCYLVQLTKIIPPQELFSNYIYFSSTSKTIEKHSEKTASYLIKRLKLNSKNFVVEIASNDGVFLKFFKKFGITVLGIDPAKNIAREANKKGIPTIPEFFTLSFSKKLLKQKKVHADLIYGANVLAHVPEIIDFVKGVKHILAKRGTGVFEFPYLNGLMENKFDIIYHEHVFYYSLISLQNLFKRANLLIYDVEKIPMQGGSLRIFVSRPGVYPVSSAVMKMMKWEKKKGYSRLETYQTIVERVARLKIKLLTFLENIKAQKKTIAAYGAPAKGIVLLNYFGVDNNYISFIVDNSLEKQGLFIPGVHMRVFSIKKILQDQPDYVLILSWNIADEIMEVLKDYKNKGGKFIIPIPKMKII